MNISSSGHDRLQAVRYYRDLGWAILPLYGPTEGSPKQRGKGPRFRDYHSWTAERLTDQLVNKYFGPGGTSNLGLVLQPPHVVSDLDSKHDKGESVKEWLASQSHLKDVPRERTPNGAHLHFHCLDLPSFKKENGNPRKRPLPASISPQVDAELFFHPLNTVLSPSVHPTGATYEWEVTGTIPEVSWKDLCSWFGFQWPESKQGSSIENGSADKWWHRFEGDLKSLDIVGLAKELRVYGRPVSGDEGKHSLRCPWSNEHGDHGNGWTASDTSAVIFTGKDSFPAFTCLHQQHGPKTLKDFLAWAEEQEPGIVDKFCARQRTFKVGQVGGDGRPQIQLPAIGRPLGLFAAEVATVIRPKKRWFTRSGLVVEPRIRGNSNAGNGFALATIGPAEVCSALEEFVETGILTVRKDEVIFSPTSMKEPVGRGLLASPQFKKGLDKVTRICELRLPALIEGELTCTKAGFDERFLSFTREDCPKTGKMALAPAKRLIEKALEGFPWKGEQDLTHAIARLVTPFCRGLMGFSVRTPLWFFEANRPRSGKDYCNGVTQIVYLGYAFEDARLNADPEEVRKRITTALASGRTMMHFANCRGRIDQTALEQAVTAPVWIDRLLGSNEEVHLPNEIDFSLSANIGVRFTPDFDARIRKISLAYPDEDPNSRRFPNPNLHGWVKRHRPQLLSAIGALVRLWVDQGMPPGPTPFTSFPEWSRAVGGIMVTAGFGDPCLPHQEQALCGDELTPAMRRLFELGYEIHPEKWITKKDIYEVIATPDEEAFSYFGDLTERGEQTKFGRTLLTFVGRTLSGIVLDQRASGSAGRSDRATYRFSRPGVLPTDRGQEVSAALFGRKTPNPNEPELTSSGDKGDSGDLPPPPLREPEPDFLPSATRSLVPSESLGGEFDRRSRRGHPMTESSGAIPSLIHEAAKLGEIASAVKAADTVALDIETYGDSLDPWRGDIRLLGLALPGEEPFLLDLKRMGYSLGPLAPALEAIEVVGHNAKFDSLWLKVKCGISLTKLFCTCTASRLLTAGGHEENDLAACAMRHLGVSLPKLAGRSDWGSLLLAPDQVNYAADDIRYLHDLRAGLDDELAAANLGELAKLEMALLPAVVAIEARGFAIDRGRLEELYEEARQKAADAVTEIRAILGLSVNPASPKQLLAALEAVGVRLPDTRDETLDSCPHGAAALIRRYRGSEKRKQNTKTLLDAIQSDGRIHGQFNPTGTDTGRFSSKEPNMQNIERGELRECFVAGPGNVLVVADYSQIELRVAAALAGETSMLQAYRSGADLHKHTAAAILKKEPTAVTAAERRLAKAINFGLLYGQSAKGLVRYLKTSYDIAITGQEAERFIARFFRAYPRLKIWQDKAKRQANDARVTEVRTSLGRRRLLPKGNFWLRYTSGLNTPIQAGAGDGLKKAMLPLSNLLPAGSHIVSTIHDEVIVETPSGDSQALARIVEQCMVQGMSELYPSVPIAVEIKVCEKWGA